MGNLHRRIYWRHLSGDTGRVSYGIRELASSRHAPFEKISRFRGAGCGEDMAGWAGQSYIAAWGRGPMALLMASACI